MINASSPAVDNPFPGLFVDTQWLEAHLHSAEFRLLQIGGEKYYPQVHIPGAALLSFKDLITQRDGVPGMRADNGFLAERFSQAGITLDTPLLVYDMGNGMDAARGVWTLASLGHPALAMLDGGLGLWYQENRPLVDSPPPRPTARFLPRPNPEWEATVVQVMAAAQPDQTTLLLDTRTPQEYLGLTVREPRGHIAGARLFNWTDALRGPQDSRLKGQEELLSRLAELGMIDPRQEIIVYCETGYRAAHTWLLLRQLGFSRVRLYDGSIAEWRLLGYPVVAGESPR